MKAMFNVGDKAYYSNDKFKVLEVFIFARYIKGGEVHYKCDIGIYRNRDVSQKLLGRSEIEALALRRAANIIKKENERVLTPGEKEIILANIKKLGFTRLDVANKLNVSKRYIDMILQGHKPYTCKLAAMFNDIGIGLK